MILQQCACALWHLVLNWRRLSAVRMFMSSLSLPSIEAIEHSSPSCRSLEREIFHDTPNCDRTHDVSTPRRAAGQAPSETRAHSSNTLRAAHQLALTSSLHIECELIPPATVPGSPGSWSQQTISRPERSCTPCGGPVATHVQAGDITCFEMSVAFVQDSPAIGTKTMIVCDA